MERVQMTRFLIAVAGAAAIASAAPAVETTVDNPLLAPWTGPYGGVPPFDKVKVAHFRPALEAAMAEQLAEVDKIAGDPAPPTFENTLAALERSGRTLDRVATVFGIYGDRGGQGREARRGGQDRRRSRPADVREHAGRPRALRPHPGPRGDGVRHLRLHDEHAGVPDGRAGHGAEAGRLLRPD